MNEEKKEEQAIVPVQPIVELAASIDDIAKQVELFQQLKTKLLGANDYQAIQNKKYIKKSGWRKIALGFNLSDEIIKEERKEYEEDGKKHFVWEVMAKAIAPNGRFSTATASCSSDERNFNKTEHDVRATAGTRAKNRAISDLVGGGEVSAEEMGSSASAKKEQAVDTTAKADNEAPFYNCSKCNAEITKKVYDYSISRFKKALCYPCQKEPA